jgi:hypothetical protein
MSPEQIHPDDLAAYKEMRHERDRMRGMAESYYLDVVGKQRQLDELLAECDGGDKQVTYTSSEVKEMMMDILRVGGLEDEWVKQRAGELTSLAWPDC